MKIINKILKWLSLVSFLAGIGIMGYAYLTNRTFINYLKTQLANAEVGGTIRSMLIGLGLIILSLIIFVISLRAGSAARRIAREKAMEAKARSQEEAEKTRKLKEEAEKAIADAEATKREALRIKEEYLNSHNEVIEDVEE